MVTLERFSVAIPEIPEGRRIAAVVLLAALMAITLMAAPGLVAALMSSWGLSAEQGGKLIGVEQLAMSIAAVPAAFWTVRPSRLPLIRISLAIDALANLLCVWIHGFSPLLGLRIVAGLAGGSVMAACLSTVATSRRPVRNFALWAVGQLILAALVLAVIAFPPAHVRAPLFYGLLALCVAAAFPAANGLASASALTPTAPTIRARVSVGAVSGLLAVFAFYLAIGSSWTFLAIVGMQDGVRAVDVEQILAIASLGGIAGCVVSAIVGSAAGRRIPLSLGFAVLGVSMAVLGRPVAPSVYATCSVALLFSWTFTLPHLLVTVSQHDSSGRLGTLANLMIGLGLGAGPYLTGLTGAPGDVRSALLFSACEILMSWVLAITSNAAHRTASS